ncbi:hypothetical protein PMAYCL1PPCAC_24976, partial [Pristionchus mayeri]
MAGNSKFVLRWEIDNAKTTLAGERGESNEFYEGGFIWTMGFNKNVGTLGKTDITLTCDHGRRGEWRCETELQFILKYNTTTPYLWKMKKTFTNGNQVLSDYKRINTPSTPLSPRNLINDKMVCEFHVNVISSKFPPILDLAKFCPNGMGNVTLVIEDKKIRVSKEYLSVHSPVFAAMFFGD